VTCGGLCPGLNTVVREVVTCLSKQYGVKKVWGVTGGYRCGESVTNNPADQPPPPHPSVVTTTTPSTKTTPRPHSPPTTDHYLAHTFTFPLTPHSRPHSPPFTTSPTNHRGFFNGPGSAADTLDDGKEEEEGRHSWVPLTPNSVDQVHML
jgi:hypothetical protein